jgi:hypothetical protein
MATELLLGREEPISADELDHALGGLPPEKRYCVELAAEAVRRALVSA